jgi:predicted helicase
VRKQVQKLENLESFIQPIQNRPFDNRYIFYHESLVERTRYDVMRHMFDNNLGLIVSRQTQSNFKHAFISENITEFNLTGTAGRYGSGYIFPLYLYNEKTSRNYHVQSMILFEPKAGYDSKDRSPNIDKAVYEKLDKTYQKNLTPKKFFITFMPCFIVMYTGKSMRRF